MVVVSDSADHLTHAVPALQADGDIVVVGRAGDADEAVRTVIALRPDVATIDLREPARRLAVEQIMQLAPTPILAFSSEPAADTGLPDLMRAGAVDSIARPQPWTAAAEAEIRHRVRVLQGVTVVRRPRRTPRGLAVAPRAPVTARSGPPARLVAIAASTGGPAALATLLAGLGEVGAPVLVVQHIHVDFLDALVRWMGQVAPVPVHLACHGDTVEPGVVYIGPGGVHLKVGAGLRIELDPEPPSQHRPSANQLFLSVAHHLGPDGVGVVLTGMGNDGAEGLLALRRRGGLTLAQDEASSAIFGMPRAAVRAGAASLLLPLDGIAAAVVAATHGRRA